MRREGRAQDDGYRSALLPGVRASADADRLAQEIAFSGGRLLALAAAPWGLYGEARALAAADLEQATWTCFLICYLGPLEGEDPFAPHPPRPRGGSRPAGGLRQALAAAGGARGDRARPAHLPRPRARAPTRWWPTAASWRAQAARRRAPSSVTPAWSAQRRFERLFERLALPGFGRMGRYELLVTLGTLGLYELRADSLHLLGVRSPSQSDLTTLGAKRLFAIGDPVHLERRAAALAEAVAVPLAALDLALANWASPQRTSAGCPPGCSDRGRAGARPRGARAVSRSPSSPAPTVSAVTLSPSAGSRRCHCASSSPRMPFE